MFFTEETYRAVIVAALQSQGQVEKIGAVIKETVSALRAADREVANADAEIRNYLQAQQEMAPMAGSADVARS